MQNTIHKAGRDTDVLCGIVASKADIELFFKKKDWIGRDACCLVDKDRGSDDVNFYSNLGGAPFDTIATSDFHLYCDLDGVLTDIEQGFKRLTPDYRKIPKRQLWDRVEETGAQFWETLAWTPDGKQLWRAIEVLTPTILTAAPNLNRTLFADSELGKRLWIRREIGPLHETGAIVCQRHEKPSFAAAGHILIDDYHPTILDWRAAGGIGILHVCAARTIDELKRLFEPGKLAEVKYSFAQK